MTTMKYKTFYETGDRYIGPSTLYRFYKRQKLEEDEPAILQHQPEQAELAMQQHQAEDDIVMQQIPDNYDYDVLSGNYDYLIRNEDSLPDNDVSNSNNEDNENTGDADYDAMMMENQRKLLELMLEAENDVFKSKPNKYHENMKSFIDSEEFAEKISTAANRSRGEMFLMILTYSVKHKLSFTALHDLFKLCNAFFEEPVLPDSRYALDKLIGDQKNKTAKFYAICQECGDYLGDFEDIDKKKEICDNCKAPVQLKNTSDRSYFVFIDPTNELSDLMQSQETYYNYVMNERVTEPNVLKDVYDDAVARAPLQGIKQFNGTFGCNWCLHPGVSIGGSKRYIVRTVQMRNSDETITDMMSATPINPINGIKYASPCILLPHFNIISGFIPDYCLEGVASQITEYYLQSLVEKGIDVKIMDELINKISVPHQIGRLTRSLSCRDDWKAREWENFVLYISVPLYYQVKLKGTFLQHWLLFVESLYIILKANITLQELEKADEMLHLFVAKTEELFHPPSMTFNVHQLTHLCRQVSNWGPVWCYSTFPFESGNRGILQAIKCAKGETHQIVRYLNIIHKTRVLKNAVFQNSPIMFQWLHERIFSNTYKKSLKIADNTYVGASKQCLDKDLLIALNMSLTNTKIFSTMIRKHCLFASSKKPNRRSNNSFALLEDEEFVQIEQFIVDCETDNEYILCKKLHLRSDRKICQQIKRVNYIDNNVELVETKKIKTICVYVKIGDNQYICPVPNDLHY
uniref:Transposase domain-containing protein n=1 Tax=Trichogramma kaykai TaxID=54128 RepID=A0ABD2WQR8_9HYME